MLSRSPAEPRPQLDGRVAIVTGGARGIGAELVRMLVAERAHVVIADRLAAEGDALAKELSVDGRSAVFASTDVADEESTRRLAMLAVERFGSIDVLINNAAVYQDLGTKLPFDEITSEQWDRVMAVNVRGVWNCARAVFPEMRERGYGKIVNVSSATVHLGVAGYAHYVASKAAVIGLTHALAREMGPAGICVNAVAPGLVSNAATAALDPGGAEHVAERAPQGRAIPREMEPRDLLGVIAFLSSPVSNFVTGQTIVVDGGRVMT